MSALEFACPKCRAGKGDPCISSGGHIRKGEPTKRPHPARIALVPPRPEEHGSYAGYQRHKRIGEVPCDSCMKANATYMRNFRANHPADYAHERKRQDARQRAMTRLARLFPDDFRRLVEEERTA